MNVSVSRFLIWRFEAFVKFGSCIGLILALPNTCNKPSIIETTQGVLFLLFTTAFIFADATNLTPRMNLVLGIWTLVTCIFLYIIIVVDKSGTDGHCTETGDPWWGDTGGEEFSAR